jgi:hypothetical protein
VPSELDFQSRREARGSHANNTVFLTVSPARQLISATSTDVENVVFEDTEGELMLTPAFLPLMGTLGTVIGASRLPEG